ncbi:MAG: hypothetical protein ACYTGZ_13755 [Planctomycetota bacterium]|jgi:hypothetical protein
MKTRFALALLASLPVVGGRDAAACDFCAGPDSGFVPLQKKIDEHGSVALASIAKVRAGDALEFRVENVLKGAAGIAPGDRVKVTTKTFPNPRFKFVLLGKGKDFRDCTVLLANNRVAAFVLDASAFPKPGTGERLARLGRLVPYLADPDLLVAASARAEFAAAPYADVKALRSRLSADALLRWLQAPATPIASRGVLGLMLGIAGDRKKHAPAMEALVRTAAWQKKRGYDGLLAGYILLRGDEALPELLALVTAEAEKGHKEPAVALLKALRFHAESEKVLTRAQILAAMRPLVPIPMVADATLWELKRLKDWESLPAVLALYRKHPKTRAAVIDYLRACPGAEAKRELARIQNS